MAQTHLERYKKTFTAFAGADICATFNGRVVGELQAITYSVTREKAPIYTLGDANPRSFSRGKRGIAGSMVFVTFDRDSLIEQMSKQDSQFRTFTTFAGNTGENAYGGMTGWDEYMSQQALQYYSTETGELSENAINGLTRDVEFEYADQIPPFNVTIVFQNEMGQAAKLELLDVEILNAGQGFSVDDVTSEMACTFICRSMRHMRPISRNGVLSYEMTLQGGANDSGANAGSVPQVSLEG